MAKKKAKQNSRKPRSTNKKGTHSSTSSKYRGPILLPASNEQAVVETFNTSLYGTYNATVGGLIDSVLSTGSVTTVADWASISGAWHEYRVLGMEVEFQPLVSYTSSYPPIIWCVDRTASGTLGSYPVAASHESAKLVSSRYAHKVAIKMDGIEEAVWTPTTTAFSWGYIKSYGANFASSQNIGTIMIRFLVQVRGRS